MAVSNAKWHAVPSGASQDDAIEIVKMTMNDMVRSKIAHDSSKIPPETPQVPMMETWDDPTSQGSDFVIMSLRLIGSD